MIVKKLLKLFSVFMLVSIIFINEIYADTYADIIKETAAAYFNKGINIQYDNYRKESFEPEDATLDSFKYLNDSIFIKNVYEKSLGIELPQDGFVSLGKYYSDYSELDDHPNLEEYKKVVIGYRENDDGFNVEFSTLFPDNVIDNNTDAYNNFKSFLLRRNDVVNTDITDLAVGDIITMTWDDGNHPYKYGHSVMVYDIKRDGDDIIDLLFMEALGYDIASNEDSLEADSLFSNLVYGHQHSDFVLAHGEDYLQGAVVIRSLAYLIESIKNEMQYIPITSFTVLRPLGFDTSTEKSTNNTYSFPYTFSTQANDNDKYSWEGMIGYSENENTIPNKALFRNSNKGLEVTKSSSSHYSYVYPGETIEYTITLTNYSYSDLTDLTIMEALGSNVTFNSAPGAIQSTNNVIWSNITVEAASTVTLTYKVDVKENATGNVVSSGKVYDSEDRFINTTTITNEIIGSHLNTNAQKIVAAITHSNSNYTDLKDSIGFNYVNDLYSTTLSGTDILLDETQLIKYFNYTNSSLPFVSTKKLYNYKTNYRTSWATDLSNNNVIAPWVDNLFTGDLIWIIEQDDPNSYCLPGECVAGSEKYYIYAVVDIESIEDDNKKTPVLVNNVTDGFHVITAAGEYLCDPDSSCDISEINLFDDVGNKTNEWRKINDVTIQKVIVDLPSNYAYAIFSPEKMIPSVIFDKQYATIDTTNKMLRNISVNTKIQRVFDSTKNNESLIVYSNDDTALYSLTNPNNSLLLATGQYVEFDGTDGNTERYKISVRGDTSGDGRLTFIDYVNIYNHIKKVMHPELENKKLLENEFLYAAEMTSDDTININFADYVAVYNRIKSLSGEA